MERQPGYVEQLNLNQRVAGSRPAAPTIKSISYERPPKPADLVSDKSPISVLDGVTGRDRWERSKWTYWGYRNGQWREVEPYGGQLTENVVSAISRELLVDQMFGFETSGYPIVFTVHDEVVVEHPEITKAMMEGIMATRPAWAEKLGVPIAAEAWVGKRYRK